MKGFFIIFALFCVGAAEAKDYWRDAVMDEPCFEGKGKKPAVMKIPEEGFVKAVRLIYKV